MFFYLVLIREIISKKKFELWFLWLRFILIEFCLILSLLSFLCYFCFVMFDNDVGFIFS